MCNLYKIIYDRNFTEHKCIFVYLNNSHPFPPWFGTAHGCCCCRGWRGSEVGGHSSHVLHSDAASVLWTSEHLKTKVNKECISQNIKLCHCRFQYWSGSRAKQSDHSDDTLGFFLHRSFRWTTYFMTSRTQGSSAGTQSVLPCLVHRLFKKTNIRDIQWGQADRSANCIHTILKSHPLFWYVISRDSNLHGGVDWAAFPAGLLPEVHNPTLVDGFVFEAQAAVHGNLGQRHWKTKRI